VTDPSYPPADDRLRHILAQRINCYVATWKLAFFIAGDLVDAPSVRAELERIAASHAAREHCGDRNCRACFTAAADGQPVADEVEPKHGELWSLLDWTFWGSGMGDVFREPLADTMLAALTPEQREQAEQLMEAWHASGRQPLGRRRYEELNAELKEAQEAIARVRAVHVPDEHGECRDCCSSFNPCPTIQALEIKEATT
jgi:hypothetical protein